MNKKLEQYSWFPYVAWTLSIGFAIFVMMLALQLRDIARDLQKSSATLDQQMQMVEEMFANESATSTNDSTGNTEN